MTKAEEILQTAAEVMKQRGALRDKGEERSMERTVRVFNALTGKGLTEVEGWTFMVALKLCREQTGHDMDNWIDATAYMALAAEAAVDTPPKPW
jgi:hypothetical protein